MAIVGAQRGVLAIFLIGQMFFGVGQASNLLARYAATDLAEPERRSQAISQVLVCSTFGAVLGPIIVGPTEHFAESLGLYLYTGPYLFSTLFCLGAMLNIRLRLKPDPLAVAGRLVADPKDAPQAPAGDRRPWRPSGATREPAWPSWRWSSPRRRWWRS